METTYWVICFIKAERKAWWDWLYRGPWRHVVAFRYYPGAQLWVMIDWSREGFHFTPTSREQAANTWAHIAEQGGIVYEWDNADEPPRLFMPIWPSWCVTVISHVIGLGRRALTPRQMLSALRASGGKPLIGSDFDSEGRHDQHVQSSHPEERPGT